MMTRSWIPNLLGIRSLTITTLWQYQVDILFTNKFQVFLSLLLFFIGKAFRYLYERKLKKKESSEEIFNNLLDRGAIYARMKPEDKTLLIRMLQERNPKNIVGMCGDGANDIGALRISHVGISLSEAEASIAAPFTSKRQDISCIISILL